MSTSPPRLPREPVDQSWSITAIAVCCALLVVVAVVVGTLAAAMVWAYVTIVGWVL